MILKIKDCYAKGKEGWYYMNGVNYVLVFPIGDVKKVEKDIDSNEKVSYDHTFLGGNCLEVLCIACTIIQGNASWNNREIEIACNTEAYLLNDNGKTIERLV